MDTSRLRPGEVLAAAGGAVLLAAMVMDWYGVGGRRVAGGEPGSLARNAWQSFTVLDVALVVVAAAGIVVVVLNVTRRSPSLPVAAEVVTTVLALLALAGILFRLVDQPGPDAAVAVEPGAYLGVVGTLAILYGAFRALQDESPRGMPAPVLELRPAPPAGGPAAATAATPAPADTPAAVEPAASPADDPLAAPAVRSPSAERRA